jgi:hypothetical protein
MSHTETQTIEQTATYKLIFFALLEAAMRYRESYFREEHEAFQNNETRLLDAMLVNEKLSFTQRNKLEKKSMNVIVEHELLQRSFNKAMYDELEAYKGSLNKVTKVAFDNYATAYGLVCEKLQRAKNTTHFLTICELYNSGTFDKDLQEAIQQGKTEELNNKYENKNEIQTGTHSTNDHSDSSISASNDQLQEEGPAADPATEYIRSGYLDSREIPGHHGGGEVPTDLSVSDHGDDHHFPDTEI